MMKAILMLIAVYGMTGCGNEDNIHSYNVNPAESLYGEWRLVGWNDGGTWFEIDANYVGHQSLSIEIPDEGVVKAYSVVNKAFLGEMTIKGNELLFSGEKLITMIGCDIMESNFFDKHILSIRSYQIYGNLLRLYYSDNDYFVFTCDFDDSKD